MAAARELGYHPNRAARALVMGSTRVVGVWTPSLDCGYVQRIFEGLTSKFRSAGFDSLYSSQSGTGDERPIEWPVDGIIYIEGTTSSLDQPFPDGIPMVIIGTRQRKGVDLIKIDLTTGTIDAVLYLLETGRTRLLCISEANSEADETMVESCQKVMESAGHHLRSLKLGDVTRSEKLDRVREYLRLEPDVNAVLCTTAELTLIARRALGELKVDVPGSLSLIGFDYSEDSDYQVPSLSALEIPVSCIVELASQMLMTRIANPKQEARIETVRTRIRTLESSTPPGPNEISKRTSMI
jgi:DNA-binding LacI/PurR family transcriptional regulator